MRTRKPQPYGRHTYPEMRQGDNGYWYIYWTNRKRASLKTQDKNIATQVFNIKRLERREKDLEGLEPKKCPHLKAYIEEYVQWRRDNKQADSTVDNDSLALHALLDFVGDKLLSEIDLKDIDKFHAWLQRPKMIRTPTDREKRFDGCKRTTVNCYIRHIKAALYKAVGWKYIPSNPYAKYKFLDEPDQPFKELTDQEIKEKLLPAIKEKDFRLMVQAYLQVGARADELCSAHRDWIVEIEDKNGIAHKWLIFPDTKRHKSRRVPIGQEMDAILAQLPEEGYLFPRWRKPQTVSHKLKRILRSIGRGDMWLHGLRHNTATKLSRKGYPVKARMKLLGHVQMSTMLRYDHPDDNDLIDAGNSLHFDPILKEPSDTEEHKKSTKHKKAK